MHGWKPATKANPCPICGRDHYCSISSDGNIVLCTRVKDGCMTRADGSAMEARDGHGWLHRVGGRKGDRVNLPPMRKDDHLTVTECKSMQKSFVSALTPPRVKALADEFGVTPKVCELFGVGWEKGAYTFPMYDGKRRICGFRTRYPGGRKCALKGSRAGLFIPGDYEAFSCSLIDSGPLLLLLPEGPSDAMAAVHLGFRAIGRPSNMGGADQLREVLTSEHRQEVVIIADRDPVKHLKDGTPFNAGIEGALSVALRIVDKCGVLKILRVPEGVKDIRQWMQEGGRPQILASLLREAEVHTSPDIMKKLHVIDGWKKYVRAKKRNEQQGGASAA